MTSISPPLPLPLPLPQSLSLLRTTSAAAFHHRLPPYLRLLPVSTSATRCFQRLSGPGRSLAVASSATFVPRRSGEYSVGDFMTRKEDLHVVKPTTTVDEALDTLVEKRITGFPVIDDNWKLFVCKQSFMIAECFFGRMKGHMVGLVSDYDLLALDSILGAGPTDTSMFPEVDSNWKTFNELQKLLSKTNGQVVGDLMTPAPAVVRESTNLEDAARMLLETKYRRLPVVDGEGKLVGIITRGNVVRAALQMKRAGEIKA